MADRPSLSSKSSKDKAMFTIENDVQRIKSTSYWDTELARQGFFFMSGFLGAWRLLVPDILLPILPKCAKADWVEFHKLQPHNGADWRINFRSMSDAPFYLHAMADMVTPTPTQTQKERLLLVYTRDGLKQKHAIRRIIVGGAL